MEKFIAHYSATSGGTCVKWKSWSGCENSSSNIIDMPLKWGKNRFHHKRSDLTKDGMGCADLLPWISLNQFKILEMKTLLVWTHEDMKDSFSTKDCNSCNVAECFCSHIYTRSKISCTLSGVTLSVNSSISNNTPMKVILVLGGRPFLSTLQFHMNLRCYQTLNRILRLIPVIPLQQNHPSY